MASEKQDSQFDHESAYLSNYNCSYICKYASCTWV